jgi:hypothetical protein
MDFSTARDTDGSHNYIVCMEVRPLKSEAIGLHLQHYIRERKDT